MPLLYDSVLCSYYFYLFVVEVIRVTPNVFTIIIQKSTLGANLV